MTFWEHSLSHLSHHLNISLLSQLPVSLPPLAMGRPENLTVPQGEEPTIANANSKAVTLKKKVFLLVKDGITFPTLVEIKQLQALSDPMGIYKELARATAKAKISKFSDLLVELESACAHLAALVLSLGEGLNEKESLDAAVKKVNSAP